MKERTHEIGMEKWWQCSGRIGTEGIGAGFDANILYACMSIKYKCLNHRD